jgi:hypothetical protein
MGRGRGASRSALRHSSSHSRSLPAGTTLGVAELARSAYARCVLVCAAPEFVPWRPDFSSSEQSSPHWTKPVRSGEQLTNAINAVDWLDEGSAVQVELCESCGFAGCESGGYVHVSRLESHVLLTPPHVDLNDPFEWHQYRPSEPVRRHGAVAIKVEDWEAWRRHVYLNRDTLEQIKRAGVTLEVGMRLTLCDYDADDQAVRRGLS